MVVIVVVVVVRGSRFRLGCKSGVEAWLLFLQPAGYEEGVFWKDIVEFSLLFGGDEMFFRCHDFFAG